MGLQADIGNQAVLRMMRAGRPQEEHQHREGGEREGPVQRPDGGAGLHAAALVGGLPGLQADIGNQAVARMMRASRPQEEEEHRRGQECGPAVQASADGHTPPVQRASAQSDSDTDMEELEVHIPQASTSHQESVTFGPSAPVPQQQDLGQGNYERRTGRTPSGYNERNLEIANRDIQLRMYDRIARILIYGVESAEQNKKARTPHIAVTMRNGVLHASGNTNRPFTEAHKGMANNFLQAALEGSKPDGDIPEVRRNRHGVDSQEIHALMDGSYERTNSKPKWAEGLKQALNKGVHWDTQVTEPGKQEKYGAASEHGEMKLLGSIIAERQTSEKAEVPEQVPIGGVKMPCLACSWVIEEVNKLIGPPNGFQIMAMETHGRPYTWNMPNWLYKGTGTLEEVRENFKKRAKEAGYSIAGRTMVVDGNQEGGSEEPAYSDSEYDPKSPTE
ncbi:hypothetical protein [Streptomyces sp. NPDC087294]|uniref:hypothetical protein n=1 Tax=Streptomyces sp. NPDC087294 TaxID=3365777 RepID=UPI0038299F68